MVDFLRDGSRPGLFWKLSLGGAPSSCFPRVFGLFVAVSCDLTQAVLASISVSEHVQSIPHPFLNRWKVRRSADERRGSQLQ